MIQKIHPGFLNSVYLKVTGDGHWLLAGFTNSTAILYYNNKTNGINYFNFFQRLSPFGSITYLTRVDFGADNKEIVIYSGGKVFIYTFNGTMFELSQGFNGPLLRSI